MEKQINSLIKVDRSFYPVTIFGYSSRGIPGLEIVGIGADGRIIKEKILYYMRSRKLGFCQKRILIGVDFKHLGKKNINFQMLEVPILILYLSLCGNLKARNLANCLSVGRFSPDGSFNFDLFNEDLEKFLNESWSPGENSCLIAPEHFGPIQSCFQIDLEGFFKNVQKIDSPENSGGLSIPSTFNTVGATSFKA